ncbi:glutamine--fructose-6-phosphate transaminase (isomerizing) [Nakamurella silvestris]|nr:glutamine--fructose-6-phosphate transaminase (isomerizing) [Nakamurella silvestris]
MCGIVACVAPADAASFLTTGLRSLEYRGYDSVGVAIATTTGERAHFRTTDRVDQLVTLIDGWSGPPLSGSGIGHTRWATHGVVNESNAHPHHDCTGGITVVHNGIIENAVQLRRALESAGHVFSSEVDSEIVCHLIEDQMGRGLDFADALPKAARKLHGNGAFAAMEYTSGRVVATTTGAPLVVATTDHGTFLASDAVAFAPWVDSFQPLEKGDLVELAPRPVWKHQGRAMVVPREVLPRLRRRQELSVGGHRDFMSKEIAEQPEMAARIVDVLADAAVSGSLWRDLGLAAFKRVAVIGCGTSLNAGAVIGSAYRRIGRVPATTIVASEAPEVLLEEGTLLLAISQSGETADVLSALDEPGLSGHPVLALTNNIHSSLGRRADAVLDCGAGVEIGVAATKTFVAQVLAGVAVVVSSLVADGRLEADAAAGLVDELRRLPDRLAGALSVSRKVVPELVPGLVGATGFLYLGRGPGVPYAAEGALKLKELTYRWAEHYPAGELKHGPLALVEPGTPVVVVDSNDRRLVGNMAEVAARGGHVIHIGGAGSTLPVFASGGASGWTSELCGPLESIIPQQVLARELALGLRRNVDMPRNLAKSVTVA